LPFKFYYLVISLSSMNLVIYLLYSVLSCVVYFKELSKHLLQISVRVLQVYVFPLNFCVNDVLCPLTRFCYLVQIFMSQLSVEYSTSLICSSM